MESRHRRPLSLLRRSRNRVLDILFTPLRSADSETIVSRPARLIEPRASADGNALALEIVEICHWMYQKGFIASSEGNVSASLGGDRIMVTPRGVHKGLLQPKQLVVTDLAGRQISGTLPPSSELPLHLLVYRERPDVRGVIHAHPTMAIVCSLAGICFDEGVVPEVITSLGGIPIAPYATPGTDEAAEVISPFIQQFDAIVLARHGSVTVGRDLRDAYSKLEMLEHTAHILVLSRLLGPLSPLPKDEVARLLIAGGRNPADGTGPAPLKNRPLRPRFHVGE